MTLHIYTADAQPAADYEWSLGISSETESHRVKTPYWHKWPCHDCRQPRYVRWLLVRVYYDYIGVHCAPGHGCRGVGSE